MNRVLLTGRPTREVETRYSANQTAISSFSLAVDSGYGEHKRTDFPKCVVLGKTAENISKIVDKGDLIEVVGELQTRNWEDEKGKHYETSVKVIEWKKLHGKKSEGGQVQQDNTDNGQTDGFYPMDVDDDLPF